MMELGLPVSVPYKSVELGLPLSFSGFVNIEPLLTVESEVATDLGILLSLLQAVTEVTESVK
jgi:hypothetical protein